MLVECPLEALEELVHGGGQAATEDFHNEEFGFGRFFVNGGGDGGSVSQPVSIVFDGTLRRDGDASRYVSYVRVIARNSAIEDGNAAGHLAGGCGFRGRDHGDHGGGDIGVHAERFLQLHGGGVIDF